ncbi:MAG: CotH kinase family protein [Bacteroidia bacterium]|nr:CotH kinase family protein [Bacteroidia bacterium]
MRFRLPFLLFAIIWSYTTRAQVIINEVSGSNVSTVADEDGDFEDWIELYNSSSQPVDLGNYSLTLYDGKNSTWVFPSIIIKPYQHMLIFASEKNRRTVLNHWEVPVYYNFPWKYWVGTSEPDTNWRKPSFNDASWLTGAGGIGYGDGDDTTVIGNTFSLYMRMTFNISDTSKISAGLCLMDFDDGFVTYLNGVELGRYNVGIQGVPPYHTDLAYEEHEATLYQTGQYSAGFILSKELMRTAIRPGLNVFGVQVHNTDFFSSDLTAIVNFLTGKSDTTIEYFPIPASSNLHTSFSLPSTGFTLTLYDANGNISDMKLVEEMHPDNSRGRKTDASPDWVLFAIPTPGDTNATSAWYTGYAGVPEFTLAPGFYQGSQSVFATGGTNGVIRYTTDGSIPKASSPIFSVPLSVDSTRVIRARLFSSNSQILPGKTITNTYFINENITLPVVSLSANPQDIWDWNTGIYVMGPNADTTFPFYGANFWQGWEKPGHAEYFDKTGNHGFELDNVLKIHGNWSKGFPQRSFRVVANDDYGQTRIPFNLFPEKQLKELKAFNLRNAGIDWNTTHMRDGLMQRAVRNTYNDIMDHTSCVVFLNGDYFGVFEIRERQDEYYIEENHGVDKDEMDLLRFHGDIMTGDNKQFLSMVEWFRLNDLTLSSNYDSARHLLDIQNITDYFTAEIYYSNPDWLGNNIKFWRKTNPPSPWRYILWDTDGGLGLFSLVTDNLLPYVTNSDTNSMYYPNPHSTIMESLLRNTEYRNYFVNRYADLMNTTFHPLNLGSLAQKIYDNMAPEMPRHFSLWGIPNSNPFGMGPCLDSSDWAFEFSLLMDFINDRPQYARYWVQQEWNLPNQVRVTLDVDPAGAGNILMNTIYPDSFPWAGIYFNGVPVSMTAAAFPGYKFSHWTSDVQLSSPVYTNAIRLNVPSNESFTAHYLPINVDMQVYPNPSDHEFNVLITVPEDAQVEVVVYDILGRRAGDILSNDHITPAGEYRLSFFPSQWGLSAGLYFIRMTNGEHTETIRIIYTDKN